jgi:hypothetical protein
MFRAARVAVLLILGFLFFNLVCGYAMDYPCVFSFVGGIYGLGVGDESGLEYDQPI